MRDALRILFLVLGAFLMLVALACQLITLASQDYRAILLFALATMTLADVCCAAVFICGGWARWFAMLIATPSLFIVYDFLRRTPYAFGLAA